MDFVTTDPTTIAVGKPLKSDILSRYKHNDDNLDARLTQVETGAASIEIMNEDVFIGSHASSTAILLTRESLLNYKITEVAIQLYAKLPAVAGTLTVDVKKGTSTDPASFSSIMTTPPSLDIATASNYERKTGVINPALQNFVTGNIVKIELSALPTNLGKIRVVVKASI